MKLNFLAAQLSLVATSVCLAASAYADTCLSGNGDCQTIPMSAINAANAQSANDPAQANVYGADGADGSGSGYGANSVNGSGYSGIPQFPSIAGQSANGLSLQNPRMNAMQAQLRNGQQLGMGTTPGMNGFSGFNGSNQPPQGSCLMPGQFNEIQRYLCVGNNVYLPIFGQSVFRQPNAQNQPDAVAVAPDYVLGIGDSFSVRIWGQLDADLQLTVDRSGSVFIPRVGTISVVGVPFGALKQHLTHEVGRVFRNFDMAVTMGALKNLQVFVVGFVQQPGTVNVNSLSSIMNALYAAGGPTANGSMRNIQLKRGNKVVQNFDLYDLLLKGDKSGDVMLQPGDVIYVPAVGPQVALRGAVRQAAIYEVNGKESLQQLIELTGGSTSNALDAVVSIERVAAGKGRVVESTRMADASKVFLRAGDIVQVYKVSNRIDQMVSLRGNVTQPVRQAWHDGMHVSDLITSRDMLLAPEFWTTRYQLDDKPATLGGLENVRRTLVTDQNEINWEYAAIERIDPVTLSTRLVPFNLAQAISKDPQQDLVLQAGDAVHVFAKSDIQVSSVHKSRYVRIEGEVGVPGIYEVKPGETLEELVVRIGGVTPRAYLYAAQFNRESVREHQQTEIDRMLDQMAVDTQREGASQAANAFSATQAANATSQQEANQLLISKLRTQKATGRIVLGMQPDAADVETLPQVELEDGDTFFVPTRPATIAIVGAVFNRNTAFVYDKRKTIGDYLHLAGGPTNNADAAQIYVVRADGSVISQNQTSMFGNVKRATALPGDTIVVPEQVDHTTFVKSALDWTQILSNFATGVAAIKVLGD